MLESFNAENLVEETRVHVSQCKGLHGLIEQDKNQKEYSELSSEQTGQLQQTSAEASLGRLMISLMKLRYLDTLM